MKYNSQYLYLQSKTSSINLLQYPGSRKCLQSRFDQIINDLKDIFDAVEIFITNHKSEMKNCDKRNNLVISRFNIVPCISRVQYCSLYLQGSILFLISPGSILFLVSPGFNIVPCISRVQYCSLYLQVQYCSMYLQGLILYHVSQGF